MNVADDRETALKALSELRSVHQGIGAVGVRWRRCRNPNSKLSKRYEKAHDEMLAKSHKLADVVSNFIRMGVI